MNLYATIASVGMNGRVGLHTVKRPLTVGVEEEFFVVDSSTRGLRADTQTLLNSVQASCGNISYSEELRPCMIESRTGICQDLHQVRAEISGLRNGLIQAAEETGAWIAATGSFPLADWRTQGFVPKPRFAYVAKTYARLAAEHVICACHVHVGIKDREMAIQVLNRVRPWLPVLSALSSSSPFWMREDTGYASYRSMVWERWPMAGMPPTFCSYDDYRQRVNLLVDTGISADAGQVFWDVRLGTRYETVEFRIADSCTTVDETVVQAGLSRALVQQCLDELERGEKFRDIRPELLRAAKWHSARFGLTGNLLDPISAKVLPAHTVVDQLFSYVRIPLQEASDWNEMTKIVERIKRLGSSAERQRRVFSETNRLVDVADLLVRETATI
jgi:carboxylate-amine ligase